jgi:hypothetical protein
LRVIALRPLVVRRPHPAVKTAPSTDLPAADQSNGHASHSKRASVAMISRPGIQIAVRAGHFDQTRHSERSDLDRGAQHASRGAVTRPAREVVLASPYAPGVRLPVDRRMTVTGRVGQHQPRPWPSDAGALNSARAVARRATEQFRQLRDRMATRALLARPDDDMARRRTMRPVVAREPQVAPRVIAAVSATQRTLPWRVMEANRMGIGIKTNSIEPSAGTDTARQEEGRRGPALRQATRPRLVRQPLPLPESVAESVAKSVPDPVPESVHYGQTQATKPSLPQLLARATPAEQHDIKDARLIERAPANVRTRKSRRHDRNARRRRAATRQAVRRPTRTSRWSRRKIDGFRPSFHRQLVRANFFRSQN